ncbi:DUF4118 domain-containing protein [bacterium]|nr:DUF4118 domain-containing protein [bacterium]
MKSRGRQDLLKEAGWTLSVCLVTWGLAGWLNTFIDYRSIAIVFLMAVVVSGVFLQRSSVLLIAGAFCLLHNFFFIPPKYTLAIRDPQDVLTYVIFFVSAFSIGHLTSRLREQKYVIQTREDRAVQLFQLAGAVSEAGSVEQVLAVANEALERVLGGETEFVFGGEASAEKDPIARRVLRTGGPVGRFTKALSMEPVTYFPLQSRKVIFGVARVKFPLDAQMDGERLQFAEALVGQVAAGLERERLHESRKKLEVLEQADRLSKALFDSISHELKTPLTTIRGATSALLSQADRLSAELLRDLLTQVGEQTDRILSVVNNMLDMTRLESGSLRPKTGLYDIADLLGPSLKEIETIQQSRVIHTRIAHDAKPLVCDAPLVVQALTNILTNSVAHTSADGGLIEIRAANGLDNKVLIEIQDNGPGLPPANPQVVFEKFYRKNPEKSGGVGLGLSIAKGFVEAQGGKLFAANHPDGGALFTLELPAG